MLQSKECQTASWKASHKKSCVIHPSLATQDDPNKPVSEDNMPQPYTSEWLEIQLDKEPSRWLQLWRSSFQMFATLSLDLANHPPDRAMTHCMKIIVQPRNWEEDPAKQYEVVDASVVRFSEMETEYPELKTEIDPTDLTRLRFVAILQNLQGEPRRIRLLQWNDRNLNFHRNLDTAASAAIMGPSSKWDEVLIASVQSGNPAKLEKMFRPNK